MIQLLSTGWRVLTIWDCEIQQKNNLEFLVKKISALINETIPSLLKPMSIKIYEEIESNIMTVAEDVVINENIHNKQ
jgi:DNA mismatch endonuclease (patch repair protein)